MSGKSSISRKISFWLSNECCEKIEQALASPANNNEDSIGKYCKAVVERHAFRHDKRKYKVQGEV